MSQIRNHAMPVLPGLGLPPAQARSRSEAVSAGHPGPAHPPARSALGGAAVTVRQLPQGQGATELKYQYKDSMEKRCFFSAIGHAVVQLVKSRFENGKDALDILAGDLANPAVIRARDQRHDLRADLGAARPTILDRQITVIGANGAQRSATIDALMTENLTSPTGLNNRINVPTMQNYVRMGEAIVEAVKNSPSGTVPLTVTVGDRTHQVHPTLDNLRAVSWYLQAKALADNADQPRPPALLTSMSGAMIAKDPGNKLYNFMKASDNAYGRASSHCAERSDSHHKMSWSNAYAKTGLIGAFLVSKLGNPLQFGVEDYGNKFPGAGGTMLFDKLKPSAGGDGTPELYLKWEPVGCPNGFGFKGKHGDDADGFGMQRHNLAKAASRMVDHGGNLAAGVETDYRGEKMEKGEARNILAAFKEAVDESGLLGKKEAKALKGDVGKYGAYRMATALDDLVARAPAGSASSASLTALKTRLDAWMEASGSTNSGIARKGAELHLST